jgi:ssDNA-binding Zn-finger/Zn-ribbon topoisomerase 1
MVRLACWGGEARCGQCGSNEVRRAWTRRRRGSALGIEPAAQGLRRDFHAPRRAATADFRRAGEEMVELTLPACRISTWRAVMAKPQGSSTEKRPPLDHGPRGGHACSMT